MENKRITVFEHESLRVDRGEKRLSAYQLEALQLFYGEKGVPYYSLIHKGVKFCGYVGVLKIGKTTIEILPKADKVFISSEKEELETVWRKVLIDMIRAVGVFKAKAPSSSSLRLKSNSILDLYFELFVGEMEMLLYRGLIKKYRKKEGNSSRLKGSIQFSKHIQENIIHKERFYVRYSTYDKEHLIHSILYKALKILNRVNTNLSLNSRLGVIALDFPEMADINVDDLLFDRIKYDRKTECYRKSIEIARLLLLNYHPDVIRGKKDVLALMFKMDLLWEQFVYVSLRKNISDKMTIIAQNTKNFWRSGKGRCSKMKPDIVLSSWDKCVVLDTKWKNSGVKNPSPEDLRQLYVYMKYYKACKVALVYPSIKEEISEGLYFDEEVGDVISQECSVINLSVEKDIRVWQNNICELICKWCGF